MALLQGLVTDKTEIIELEPCTASDDERLEAIGLRHYFSSKYIKNMYLYKGIWHYFKPENNCYFYGITDELVGSRLAKGRGLKVVDYKVARVLGQLGIVSPNFKQDKYKYKLLSEIIDDSISYKDSRKLDLLLSVPKTEENRSSFSRDLFNFLAIDIHMLQKDRANVNLQFQFDLEKGCFDLAHLYDFEICSSKVGPEGIHIPSNIVKLDYINIISLAQKYPLFKEALEFILEEDMVDIWNQICQENNFDMGSCMYERVLDYYETKEKYQKHYIKNLLSRV